MRKILAIVIFLIILMPPICQAKTTILNLVDISGSLADARDLFRKNMQNMNKGIDLMDKNDHFTILAFRSHGQLWKVVDYQFPKRRGGKNKKIIKARHNLRMKINQGFNTPPTDLKLMGGQTDITGALNLAILRLGDMNGKSNQIKLHVYSDGFQTPSIGTLYHLKNIQSYPKRKTKMVKYLKALEKKLSSVHLAKPPQLNELVWFGAVDADDLNLLSTDLGYLESNLRRLWVSFLEKELPETRIIYKLKY